MDRTLTLVIAGLAGLMLAWPLRFLFGRLPEAWLQDYDYDPSHAGIRPAKRMRILPDTLLLGVILGVSFGLAVYFNPQYIGLSMVFHVLLVTLPLLPLSLIVVSDALNRIIPDQFTLCVLVFSLFGFFGDIFEGTLWMSDATPWYVLIVYRLFGGLIGAGLLFGIGILGTRLSGQDSIGFGDIKLIFALGLLTGPYGLVFDLFFAFIVGGLYAIPLFVAKRRRIRAEEAMILKSDNPEETRLSLEEKRAGISYSDDPDYIAFGPFLAIGAAVFLVFETPIYHFFVEFFVARGI